MTNSLFRIRCVETGLYYQPKKRHKWAENGRVYTTMNYVRKAFRSIMNKDKVNRSMLEIVEYELVEKRIVL